MSHPCPITTSSLWSLPLTHSHKQIIITHYNRIWKTLSHTKHSTESPLKDREVALEQLARMTLVLTDYITLHRLAVERGQNPNHTIESMVADVVDAAMYVPGTELLTAVNPQLWGREGEIGHFMRVLDGDGREEREMVEEEEMVALEKMAEEEKVVLDQRPRVHDLGEGIEWDKVLLRSRSENNIVYKRKGHKIEENDKEEWSKKLLHRRKRDLELRWPPPV